MTRSIAVAVTSVALATTPATASADHHHARAARLASIDLFHQVTDSRHRRSNTNCRRKTTWLYWRCRTVVHGTKRTAGTFDALVHRRTLRVRVTGYTIVKGA